MKTLINQYKEAIEKGDEGLANIIFMEILYVSNQED